MTIVAAADRIPDEKKKMSQRGGCVANIASIERSMHDTVNGIIIINFSTYATCNIILKHY